MGCYLKLVLPVLPDSKFIFVNASIAVHMSAFQQLKYFRNGCSYVSCMVTVTTVAMVHEVAGIHELDKVSS